MELYVTDSRVPGVSETFTRAAKTGVLGDDKIFVTDSSQWCGSGSARRGNARGDDTIGELGEAGTEYNNGTGGIGSHGHRDFPLTPNRPRSGGVACR